jgi:penicillin-binding protein 1C
VTLVDCQGRPLALLASPAARAAEPVPLDRMGPWLPRFTVALEDHRFETHFGIDPLALGGAVWDTARAGTARRGASTIHQQLIKLASGRTTPSFWGKSYEALAGLKLGLLWPQNTILTEYLNRLPYGNRLVGPEAAARAYFQKHAADLTQAEAIFLAGIPQAPTRLNPWKDPEPSRERFRRNVRRLARLGFLTPEDAQQMAAQPPPVLRHLPGREAEGFVEAVLAAHPNLLGRVTTTLDLHLQRVAEDAAHRQLEFLRGQEADHAAVVILENRTGAVRAMVTASADPRHPTSVNAALAYRSTGSTLKPFLYLLGLESRVFTAATLLPDTPDAVRSVFPDYDPANYDRRFLGPVRLRQALGNSLNVPAVYALHLVGPRHAFATFEEWGLKFGRRFDDAGAGFILGNAECRLLDLAAGYAAFASGGIHTHWKLLEDAPDRRRVLASPASVDILNSILSDNEARRETFGPDSPLAFPSGQRIPAKTGTSSGFRDTWAIGSTAQHTVAVWVGNLEGRPMRSVASVRGAAPLWRALLDHLLATDAPVPRYSPEGSTRRVPICTLSGLLPAPGSPATTHEEFLPGTEPTLTAEAFFQPDDRGGQRILLPAAYEVWCRTPFNRLGATIRPHSGGPAILSPAAGTCFVLDPLRPAQAQAFLLIAGGTAGRPEWRVDGQPIAATNGQYLVPLQPGRHTVTLIAEGRQVAATYEVVP